MHPIDAVPSGALTYEGRNHVRGAIDEGLVAFVQRDALAPRVVVQHLRWTCLVDTEPPERIGGMVLCPACSSAGWLDRD